MAQEKGYDTFLEDGGGSLSQGQKQLISFARAVIRNPSILILDEATSSIDTETEAAVQKAIQPLAQRPDFDHHRPPLDRPSSTAIGSS
jgi:ABC-type multidrug transport system fused ATPase/permease subunit